MEWWLIGFAVAAVIVVIAVVAAWLTDPPLPPGIYVPDIPEDLRDLYEKGEVTGGGVILSDEQAEAVLRGRITIQKLYPTTEHDLMPPKPLQCDYCERVLPRDGLDESCPGCGAPRVP